MMKNLLLFAFLLSTFYTYGQQNGTWVISGDIGFRTENTKDIQRDTSDDETNQLQVIAKIGYIFTNSNFEIGIAAGYGSDETFSPFNDSTGKFITTSIAPYVKQYFPINDKFAFHLIGEAGFTKTYLENTSGNDEIDIKGVGIVLRPGFVYFVTKHIALSTNLGSFGYINTTSNFKSFNDTESESFGFSFNSSNILFGVAYYF